MNKQCSCTVCFQDTSGSETRLQCQHHAIEKHIFEGQTCMDILPLGQSLQTGSLGVWGSVLPSCHSPYFAN